MINRYIDKVCRLAKLSAPVTFPKQSRKAYLGVIKYKRKSRSMINNCKEKMLAYLYRDISSFIELIAVHGTGLLDLCYNECTDLEHQITLYTLRFGHYPAKIYADKIYMNRVNRGLMKDLGIEAMGKPLGRPPKQSNPEEERRMSNSVGERNEVEATFGTGKRIYRANNIRAKLPETAACWTGMCYFVKNLMKFLRELLWLLFFVRRFCENLVLRKQEKTGETVSYEFAV